MHFLVRTIADAGRPAKLPSDQADEFVKHRCQHLPADAAAGFAVLGLHAAPDWDRYAAARPHWHHSTRDAGVLREVARPRITGCSARRKTA
jgi:hypothetical protein